MDIMKIQKLAYFISGRYIAKTNTWPINNNFIVHPYGPILKDIYNYYRETEHKTTNKYGTINKYIHPYIKNTDYTLHIEAEKIMHEFGMYHDMTLAKYTHKKNAPWYTTLQKTNLWTEIEPEKIKEYFKNNTI